MPCIFVALWPFAACSLLLSASLCYWHLVTLLHGLYHTHFSVFIHAIHWRTWWLKQTYTVLHAASFSSWIDITNHKGKHWRSLYCGVVQISNYCWTSASSNKYSLLDQIQLLADLNLKKTPQLVELFDDSKVNESILSLFFFLVVLLVYFLYVCFLKQNSFYCLLCRI